MIDNLNAAYTLEEGYYIGIFVGKKYAQRFIHLLAWCINNNNPKAGSY